MVVSAVLLLIISTMFLSSFTGSKGPDELSVDAGPDIYLSCQNQPFSSVTVNGTATEYLYVLWSTDGDGYFYDPTSLSTEYYFGSGDIQNGTVTLTLTAYGNYGVSESDELIIYFPKQLIKIEPVTIYMYSDSIIDSIPVIINDTLFYEYIYLAFDSIVSNSRAISTYYDFSDKTIGQVLEPLGDMVFNVHDADGPVDLNEQWDSRSAYRVKAKDTCCLGIYGGEPIFDRKFVFEPGIKYYMPVLCEYPVSLIKIFSDSIGSPIEHLFRIDDFRGNTTYPQFDADGIVIPESLNIDTLFPGKGYEVSVSQTIEIEFPGHIHTQIAVILPQPIPKPFQIDFPAMLAIFTVHCH